MWIYYSAQIILFGAEFTQVYANTYGNDCERSPTLKAFTEHRWDRRIAIAIRKVIPE